MLITKVTKWLVRQNFGAPRATRSRSGWKTDGKGEKGGAEPLGRKGEKKENTALRSHPVSSTVQKCLPSPGVFWGLPGLAESLCKER